MHRPKSREKSLMQLYAVSEKILKTWKCLTVCCFHATYGFQSESALARTISDSIAFIVLANQPSQRMKKRDRKHRFIISMLTKIFCKHLSDCNRIWTHNNLVRKQKLNHLPKLAIFLMIELLCDCFVFYYLVMYVFQCEFTFYSCLNVKGLLARNRCNIWSLSDSNRIRTHSHSVCKWRLNHLAKLAVPIPLLSFKLQILCLFWTRSSLIFRQL